MFYLIGQLRGRDNAARWLGVKVGTGCRIYTRNFGSEPWLITIGDRVTVTSGVQFLTHDGSTWLTRDAKGRRYRYARIQVGSDAFIGVNAILLPGVRVGSRVIIGAGSVVTKSVSDGLVVAGNPARVVGRFEDYEKKALESYACAADLNGNSYRERIDAVVEPGFRPNIEA